ncbi:hypothetical protein ABG964_22535, partial [Clostridium butyricum]
KILNPSSIKRLTKKLIEHYNKMLSSNNDELKSLDKRLKEIDFEIGNIVNAISRWTTSKLKKLEYPAI